MSALLRGDFCVRILIFIILMVVLKRNNKNKKVDTVEPSVLVKRISYFLSAIFILFIFLFPYEKYLINLNTVDKAINYYNSFSDVIGYYENDNNVIVYSVKKIDNASMVTMLSKNKSRYYQKYNFYFYFPSYGDGYCHRDLISVVDRSISGVTGVAIYYLGEEDVSYDITDEYGSEFKEFKYDDGVVYLTLVDKTVSSDYEISINGNTCRVLADG